MRRSWFAFGILATALTACHSWSPAPERISINLSWLPPDACRVEFAGESFDLQRDNGRLMQALKREAARFQTASIVPNDLNVPYKCVAAAIITAQQAGFVRVGFVAEPPPANR